MRQRKNTIHTMWKEVVELSLADLWFLLISVLFVGFFFLEGFDFGVGMGVRFLARTNKERRILINTIGPFWDANEVWLITAAGAMFAAFPHWYSTLFSGYYILLTVVLFALIARGVSFEFRNKVDHVKWRRVWDAAIFIGSIVPPLIFGMMFASMIRGMPIGADMDINATFSDYINGYTLWVGLTVTLLCFLHGLTFITLRTTDDLRVRARRLASRLLPFTAVMLVGLVIFTGMSTDMFVNRTFLLVGAVMLGMAFMGLDRK